MDAICREKFNKAAAVCQVCRLLPESGEIWRGRESLVLPDRVNLPQSPSKLGKHESVSFQGAVCFRNCKLAVSRGGVKFI